MGDKAKQVNDIKELVTLLSTRIHYGATYKNIADHYKVNKGLIHMIVNDNYEPKAPDIRAKLGLPAIAPVTFITTVNTEGKSVQAHTVARCNCGQHFVPNTGKRYQCFTCEPFRRRKE